ncbi:serine/threonine-protein kinase [Actinomadura montaniterrae]|uniref:serine/threonine-protein kinase n=1 Tax=Actinomadura montaniterrae TaxID=1803903 RepID=UPI00178C597F|nr:serine/threonine-protein kinase [Actinomadura montaniterrae]
MEIAGRYRLEHVLGGGGFGKVWRAVDLLRDRPVAVKVLHPEVAATSPVWLSKFRQEARIAARLKHPSITTVDDFGEYCGQWYLVMEFLEGVSLEREIAEHPEGLMFARAHALGAQVADGLATSHELGIVHRDLKPSNVMVLDGDHVKICDFGIAHIADASATHTLSGQAAGTPTYMAPEQWLGQAVDQRTDLYAFGGLLYALLTGRPPFPGPSTPALMGQHLNMTPIPPSEIRPDIPAAMDQLVLGLLAKEPSQCPEQAADVLSSLHRMIGLHTPTSQEQVRSSIRSAQFGATAQLLPPSSPFLSGDQAKERPRRRWSRRALLATAAAAIVAVSVPLTFVIDPAGSRKDTGAKTSDGTSKEVGGIAPNGADIGNRPDPGTSSGSGIILDFGKTYVYSDKLTVRIGKPERITPTAFAAVSMKTKYYVMFAITVTNRTSKPYSPSSFYATLQNANREMQQVFDSGRPDKYMLSGNPNTSLLPGREVAWSIAFGVNDPNDLILEIAADSNRGKVIFKT